MMNRDINMFFFSNKVFVKAKKYIYSKAVKFRYIHGCCRCGKGTELLDKNSYYGLYNVFILDCKY